MFNSHTKESKESQKDLALMKYFILSIVLKKFELLGNFTQNLIVLIIKSATFEIW